MANTLLNDTNNNSIAKRTYESCICCDNYVGIEDSCALYPLIRIKIINIIHPCGHCDDNFNKLTIDQAEQIKSKVLNNPNKKSFQDLYNEVVNVKNEDCKTCINYCNTNTTNKYCNYYKDSNDENQSRYFLVNSIIKPCKHYNIKFNFTKEEAIKICVALNSSSTPKKTFEQIINEVKNQTENCRSCKNYHDESGGAEFCKLYYDKDHPEKTLFVGLTAITKPCGYHGLEFGFPESDAKKIQDALLDNHTFHQKKKSMHQIIRETREQIINEKNTQKSCKDCKHLNDKNYCDHLNHVPFLPEYICISFEQSKESEQLKENKTNEHFVCFGCSYFGHKYENTILQRYCYHDGIIIYNSIDSCEHFSYFKQKLNSEQKVRCIDCKFHQIENDNGKIQSYCGNINAPSRNGKLSQSNMFSACYMFEQKSKEPSNESCIKCGYFQSNYIIPNYSDNDPHEYCHCSHQRAYCFDSETLHCDSFVPKFVRKNLPKHETICFKCNHYKRPLSSLNTGSYWCQQYSGYVYPEKKTVCSSFEQKNNSLLNSIKQDQKKEFNQIKKEINEFNAKKQQEKLTCNKCQHFTGHVDESAVCNLKGKNLENKGKCRICIDFKQFERPKTPEQINQEKLIDEQIKSVKKSIEQQTGIINNLFVDNKTFQDQNKKLQKNEVKKMYKSLPEIKKLQEEQKHAVEQLHDNVQIKQTQVEISKIKKRIDEVKEQRGKIIKNLRKDIVFDVLCDAIDHWLKHKHTTNKFKEYIKEKKILKRKEFKTFLQLDFYSDDIKFKHVDGNPVNYTKENWDLVIKFVNIIIQKQNEFLRIEEKKELCKLTRCLDNIDGSNPCKHICEQCGIENPIEALFCSNCGVKL